MTLEERPAGQPRCVIITRFNQGKGPSTGFGMVIETIVTSREFQAERGKEGKGHRLEIAANGLFQLALLAIGVTACLGRVGRRELLWLDDAGRGHALLAHLF